MGNIQTNEKQQKIGKSPAKGKHFIRNLNRKSSGRESKKHGRKKSDAKREAIGREYDKTPDSDNNEPIEASDNDTVECVFKTLTRDGEGGQLSSVHSEVTVIRCESCAEPRSPTRDQPPAIAALPAASPANDSTSESVFTDPLTPLAIELNQCYYSAESDSVQDEPLRTHLQIDALASPLTGTVAACSPVLDTLAMPYEDATSTLSTYDMEKEEKFDIVDDSSDRAENEKVMGGILSVFSADNLEKSTHECNQDFRDNRLKTSPVQTSFTVSKHRKVELPPVACEPSLSLLDNAFTEKDRRPASVSEMPSLPESNVLRKVASLTLDKHSESKIVRPKFVPDKLDFRLYEKFEGQMLVNWFVSSIAENNHLKSLLGSQDLKNLGIQYCTHLLAAGVLRQISDKNAPSENIFKPSLMYYWAHMETPASQPVTPGKLHMSAWPPDNRNNIEIKLSNQTNNEEIRDIDEAKVIISQLKRKLLELEYKLEKYKISTQPPLSTFDAITEYNLARNKTESSRELETSNVLSDLNKLSFKPVINIPDPVRTNQNNDNAIDISSLDNKNEMTIKDVTSKPDSRSDKIENYCKLNKSRDSNSKSYRNESISEGKEVDKIETKANEPPMVTMASKTVIKSVNNYDNKCVKAWSENSSDNSCLNTCASTDSIVSKDKSSSDIQVDINLKNNLNTTHGLPMQVFCAIPDKNQQTSQILEEPNKIVIETRKILKNQQETSEFTATEISLSHDTVLKELTNAKINHSLVSKSISQKNKEMEACPSPPPPHPGMLPPPPPMPGTLPQTPCDPHLVSSNVMHLSPSMISNLVSISDSETPKSQPTITAQVREVSLSLKQPSPPPILGTVPLPPPMPGTGSTPPMFSIGSPPMPEISQNVFGMAPPPPPISGMGPPPPPMPSLGPPPPMPGMGPPPPSMPGMGPPPPQMPSMGPPPPPMPGMGPPPPPMPGMGPPPPPMPGMGPPPPPMPGMGPPPPPMPGMGPPPPPMPGINPPPPPMPGSGLPPMPGSGPTPPPPNLGPVPFPAPPLGGWNMQRSTLRKIPIKPAAPMKPLYWTRILANTAPPPCQGESESSFKPLWLEIEETNLDNIDEFTDLFSRQVVKAPAKKKVEVKTKIKPVKILDSKRSQNVGILAQSLHVEFSEIENAIYNFDTSVVSLEALQQIYELRANEEELSLIQQHLKTKPEIPLDRPEAFLHDLSSIPNFADRISCFMFQADFEDSISTTMHKLDNLKHTCEFLTTSESLKKLFAIILTLGNYMNGGNGQRGQADGFGLEILAKLKDVKSKQSNVTLLHFIVRTYMRREGEGSTLSSAFVLPVPEPGDVARAAAIDFADVAANLDALNNQLQGCKDKTKKVTESDIQTRNLTEDPSVGEGKRNLEVFRDKMNTFLNTAEEKLKTEYENLEECRNKFIATVKFYQYSPKCGKREDCEPKEFFSLWTAFCTDFKDIYKKEEQIAIKEKLKEAKKLQGERKSLTQPIKEGGLKARLQKLSTSRK